MQARFYFETPKPLISEEEIQLREIARMVGSAKIGQRQRFWEKYYNSHEAQLLGGIQQEISLALGHRPFTLTVEHHIPKVRWIEQPIQADITVTLEDDRLLLPKRKAPGL